MKRDLIVLTAVALVVRTGVALLINEAPWTDSAYYFISGRQMATGHGLTVPFLWSFLETGGRIPSNPMLPIPSHAHWMPLTAFVAAAGMELFGPTWRAAQVPMVLLSTALTPLSYLMAMRIWGSRLAAVVGSLLVVFAGPLLLMGSIVENFAVFGLAGAGALYAAMRSVAEPNQRRGWLIVSGVLVGVSTLARIDGVLLAIAPATAWLIGMRWIAWRTDERRPGWLAGIGSLLAFAVVVAPWGMRNLATFGALLPSTGGHTLWIRSYNEQFSVTVDTSLGAYLAQGPVAIIGAKLQTWLTIGGYTVALLAGIFGLFFLAALWLQRRRAEMAPFIVYFVVMFVVMGGLFTFHAPNGLFYHHAAAWLPIAAPMALTAIAPLAGAGARWWRFLGRPATHRFLVVVSLLATIPYSLVASGLLLAEWRTNLRAAHDAGAFLSHEAPRSEVVMFRDAPLLYAATGQPAVGPPFDPYPVIGQVARAYHVRWFVVQRQSRGPAVEPQGLWDGGRAVDAQGNHADWLASQPSFDNGTVRIYEVLDK